MLNSSSYFLISIVSVLKIYLLSMIKEVVESGKVKK